MDARSHFTSTEVLQALGGKITYRQFDYWCRRGIISIDVDGLGSGTPRGITEPEMLALSDLIDEYRRAQAILAHITSGGYFHDRLTHYEQEEITDAAQDSDDRPSPGPVLDGSDRRVPSPDLIG